MTSVPAIELNAGVAIPQLGFGVFQVPADQTATAVATALDAGYRSLDTAAAYGNEREVGEAIAASGIPREEIFVTTKLWNGDQGRDGALRAFERSLDALATGWIDLYLIHWPLPMADRYVETWRTFEELRGQHLHAIGVSNFQIPHLERLLRETETVPAVNQIELHPHLQQPALRAFHAEHGIATEAWSPLAQGAVFDDPVIAELAESHDRSPAQIVLRWHLQLGNVVIPKSVTPSRIAQNFAVFDFSLDAEAMARISTLDRGTRTGPDPDTFSVGA